MNKKTFIRILSLLLSLLICFSAMSVSITAFAADDVIVEGEPEDGEDKDVYANAADVSSADELADALAAQSEAIRITADFQIDRTFFVISDVTIFTDDFDHAGVGLRRNDQLISFNANSQLRIDEVIMLRRAEQRSAGGKKASNDRNLNPKYVFDSFVKITNIYEIVNILLLKKSHFKHK